MSALLLLLLLLGLLLCVLRRRTRRPGEPPLIRGWIPFLGKALEFGRDAHKFLEEQRRRSGDVFTVLIAGRYMTFIMDPLLYPSVIKHGRQLDFHQFADSVAPPAFGYPPVRAFPGLWGQVRRSFQLLQGDALPALTQSMLGNLQLVLRQDHSGRGWSRGLLSRFCSAVMFEATLMTVYGRAAGGGRHAGAAALLRDFCRFDAAFPLLLARVPVRLLGRTRSTRELLIQHFLPQNLDRWTDTSLFIRRRAELFEQYPGLRDRDKAAHHFAILWASVGNTLPAAFWVVYFLLSHQGALQAVRQQILQVLRADGVQLSLDRDLVLSREQLDRFILLDSAISESLRLSSASTNVRVALEDFSLQLEAGAVGLRRGDVLALFPQSLHLDPQVYPDPQAFRFDRFVQDGREKTDFYKSGRRLRFFLMPFGSGGSVCPGRHFALSEIKQFLVLLLLFWELRLEGAPPRPALDPRRVGLGILLPATDVPFSYRLRDARELTGD